MSNLKSAEEQLEFDLTKSQLFNNLHHRLDTLQEKHGYKSIQWGAVHALSNVFQVDDEGYHLHSPVYEL